jgi:hypothetical protein
LASTTALPQGRAVALEKPQRLLPAFQWSQPARELAALEAYADALGTATPDHEVLIVAGVDPELSA